MPQKNDLPLVKGLITLIVGVIIAGAVWLAVMATFENMRLLQFNGQVFNTVQLARNTAAQQKNFALTAGEDMWGSLAHLGVITDTNPPYTPWRQPLTATITNNNSIRLETTLPAVACRRTVFYLLDHAPATSGLVAAQARAATMHAWVELYPPTSVHIRGINTVEFGCGNTGMSQLGLTFQIR